MTPGQSLWGTNLFSFWLVWQLCFSPEFSSLLFVFQTVSIKVGFSRLLIKFESLNLLQSCDVFMSAEEHPSYCCPQRWRELHGLWGTSGSSWFRVARGLQERHGGGDPGGARRASAILDCKRADDRYLIWGSGWKTSAGPIWVMVLLSYKKPWRTQEKVLLQDFSFGSQKFFLTNWSPGNSRGCNHAEPCRTEQIKKDGFSQIQDLFQEPKPSFFEFICMWTEFIIQEEAKESEPEPPHYSFGSRLCPETAGTWSKSSD